jgi:putative transcriptional regulator
VPRDITPRGLGRHLLIAVPQLLDPNFERAVILLLEHGSEGAFGLVLNNPMPTTVRDVAASLELQWDGDSEALVRLGGPVEPVRGWILHDRADWDGDGAEILPGVFLTTSLESIKASGEASFGGEGHTYVMLLGYAGWGEGQLEQEIAAGSWVIVPVQGVGVDEDGPGVAPEWLLEVSPATMWSSALAAIGVDPSRLVGMHTSLLQ